MNAIIERWVQYCRQELLDRTLTWNERHPRHALRQYEQFYSASTGVRNMIHSSLFIPLRDRQEVHGRLRRLRDSRKGLPDLLSLPRLGL
jgi:putative transposase